jgi:hypothetical protein
VIVVRNVFRLKFGKAKDAVAVWREGMANARKMGFSASSLRLLTDVSGPFYTLVFENTFDSLGDYENSARTMMGNPEWRAWYEKTLPFTESGYREIFTVID